MVFITIQVIESFFLNYFHRMLNHHQTSPFLCFLKHLFERVPSIQPHLRMRVKGKLKGKKQPGEAGPGQKSKYLPGN